MEALRPLKADPAGSALFFDVDGTLAPIVQRAEDAQVPKDTSLLLARLSRRYARVACISGRAAADVLVHEDAELGLSFQLRVAGL